MDKELHNAQRRIRTRLRSILVDADFVTHVINVLQVPAFCNERCGRWYVDPRNLTGSVYFKSTDGHQNHVQFSTRRLNLHLIPYLSSSGVCIVDATTKGKRIPDALSKTVPVWCCTLTRFVNRCFHRSLDETLYFPRTVHSSEHAQVSAQIDGFVETLLQSSVDRELFKCIEAPIRPFWVTPESTITKINGPWYAVICVSASKVSDDVNYLQGAGDDEEMWAKGLSPSLLFTHQREIMDSEDIDATIAALILNSSTTQTTAMTRIRRTNVYLGDSGITDVPSDWTVIDMRDTSSNDRWYHVKLDDGKRGSQQLLKALHRIDEYLQSRLDRNILLIDSNNCKSRGAVVALMVLALYYSPNDELIPRATKVDKEILRNRLITITASRPGINPSRADLKILNTYLMSNKG